MVTISQALHVDTTTAYKATGETQVLGKGLRDRIIRKLEVADAKLDAILPNFFFQTKLDEIGNYIYQKFEKKISLLRRDFSTGLTIPHFLRTNKKWFIDPFGGFFINDLKEMDEYMKTSNELIFLMRHVGNTLKKRNFSDL